MEDLQLSLPEIGTILTFLGTYVHTFVKHSNTTAIQEEKLKSLKDRLDKQDTDLQKINQSIDEVKNLIGDLKVDLASK